MADTTQGLNRAELVKQCNKYAIKYGVDIPIATTDWGDFGKKVKNNPEAKELHKLLLERYSSYSDIVTEDKKMEQRYTVDASCPTVFISYSWDDDEHKRWVKDFADKLLSDGVNAVVDQYDLSLGDR